MGRRKPISGKARKEHLKLKRAVKREHEASTEHGTATTPSGSRAATSLLAGASKGKTVVRRHMTPEQKERQQKIAGRMQLESRFLRLPQDVLEHHRTVAATEPLDRPINDDLGVLRWSDLEPTAKDNIPAMTCPRRPKWRYSMSKLEVEKNEEGMFRQWLAQTDESLRAFTKQTSPTFFERNLNVWRQLWRTTEISDILLILIDVRFPFLHYPPSLETYVKGLRDKRVILVLTKTDLVPAWLAEAWQRYFEEREGPSGAEVITMESYREVEVREETQGTQPRYVPGAPPSARTSLVEAMRRAHQSLLTPLSVVADFPERLARWSPRVRREVDWDSVEDEQEARRREEQEHLSNEKRSRRRKDRLVFRPKRQGLPESTDQESEHEGERDETDEGDSGAATPTTNADGDDPYPHFSIGLIGQPNVGKSSLLNALLGRKVVRASRTPGKTKHIQTHYWNKTLRLVDCPGLVCPSFAGMERQVMAGVIPVQNIEPVLHFVCQLVPLENVLKLEHPESETVSLDEPTWTTDTILVQYALQQDFVTAKAGRPDIYRAGAQILRQIHSSQIPWGFRPSFGSGPTGDASNQGTQEGIWLKDFVARASVKSGNEGDVTAEEDEDQAEGSELDASEDESDEQGSQEEANHKAIAAVRSAFSALEVEGGASDDDDDDFEDSVDGESSVEDNP